MYLSVLYHMDYDGHSLLTFRFALIKENRIIRQAYGRGYHGAIEPVSAKVRVP